jgi:hypothetical protein
MNKKEGKKFKTYKSRQFGTGQRRLLSSQHDRAARTLDKSIDILFKIEAAPIVVF